MKIRAIIHPAEEGGYWAEVPALPGCITEGDTRKEVMVNLKDAIEGWLEVANSRNAISTISAIAMVLYHCLSSLSGYERLS
ncbi:type II toxin-antitoxin system HicB family antitoxin [Nostoc sp. ChiQUE01b]|uniref:type II toxin-antitoxin system HicB family antitoxin n=1 Tax=Nostoc sp. ChiQUE01b TaxID=3075376 RepID=UPI002AD215FA|nr:type II toxin-antitoxin system HicB family antitoxin [Nostoc sp. ChiQUE01b]MDZ8258403.1 type II toxin-antitoxin system HicB family antitoxin [Nostoc sp. ChiQUE01b]